MIDQGYTCGQQIARSKKLMSVVHVIFLCTCIYIPLHLIVFIPLDDVRKGWTLKQYPHQVQTMASYFGIFDHMFNSKSFKPTVVLNVEYQDDDLVHYGNFLEPTQVRDVSFQLLYH